VIDRVPVFHSGYIRIDGHGSVSNWGAAVLRWFVGSAVTLAKMREKRIRKM
jgi:hypothetical protein